VHRLWRTKLSHLAEGARNRALERGRRCFRAREFRFDAELDEVGPREVCKIEIVEWYPVVVERVRLTVDTVPVVIWRAKPKIGGPQLSLF